MSATAAQSDLFGLGGANALVVGGGQGMGEASARLLARLGCNVAVLDFVAERATALAAALGAGGTRAIALQADVLDDQAAAAAVGQAAEQLGPLDLMVTIVGQAGYVPLVEMDAATWDLDQRRNLRYVFVMGQAWARLCIAAARPGAMVVVTSVSGIQSAPKHAAYGAAKAGLINLVKSMAVEWAPHQIRVNAVAPGSILTPRRPDSPERQAEIAGSLIPMKRRGTVEDVAQAVAFLGSAMARYVTGHTLAVDGGWTAASMYRR